MDLNNGVYTGELWNPATGKWTTMAPEQVTRQYHSTALLLPDGRVLSAGGGICGTCDSVGYLGKNGQVFSPPYLFKKDGSGDLAPRPEITSAPGEVGYNAPFSISTPNPSSIRKVALVRLGAVTHSVNMEQRYVPLSYSVGSGALNATSPANSNIAPPGFYMLFLIDSSGVPSVSKMVKVTRHACAPSPSGPKITFSSKRDGNDEIYSMNADGSGQTRLTTNSASDYDPAYSPGAQKIAFTSKRDGNDEIYVDERRRLGPDAADQQHGKRRLPGLLARRAEDRLRLHPRRQLGDLRDERRRDGPDAADQQHGLRRLARLLPRLPEDLLHQHCGTATSRSTR